MSRRTGTYIAFDGLGETDPTKSDFKYYGTIQGWDANKNIEFNFVNSHEKTYAVRDTSTPETLKARIRERLSKSKHIVVILSSQTRKTGSMLSYEIEWAIDNDKIPLIIAYVDYDIIANPVDLSTYWPTSLKTRIDNGAAKAIHIGFRKEPLLDAISQFSNNNMPINSLGHYSEAAYKEFGILSLLGRYQNTLKGKDDQYSALKRFLATRGK